MNAAGHATTRPPHALRARSERLLTPSASLIGHYPPTSRTHGMKPVCTGAPPPKKTRDSSRTTKASLLCTQLASSLRKKRPPEEKRHPLRDKRRNRKGVQGSRQRTRGPRNANKQATRHSTAKESNHGQTRGKGPERGRIPVLTTDDIKAQVPCGRAPATPGHKRRLLSNIAILSHRAGWF